MSAVRFPPELNPLEALAYDQGLVRLRELFPHSVSALLARWYHVPNLSSHHAETFPHAIQAEPLRLPSMAVGRRKFKPGRVHHTSIRGYYTDPSSNPMDLYEVGGHEAAHLVHLELRYFVPGGEREIIGAFEKYLGIERLTVSELMSHRFDDQLAQVAGDYAAIETLDEQYEDRDQRMSPSVIEALFPNASDTRTDSEKDEDHLLSILLAEPTAQVLRAHMAGEPVLGQPLAHMIGAIARAHLGPRANGARQRNLAVLRWMEKQTFATEQDLRWFNMRRSDIEKYAAGDLPTPVDASSKPTLHFFDASLCQPDVLLRDLPPEIEPTLKHESQTLHLGASIAETRTTRVIHLGAHDGHTGVTHYSVTVGGRSVPPFAHPSKPVHRNESEHYKAIVARAVLVEATGDPTVLDDYRVVEDFSGEIGRQISCQDVRIVADDVHRWLDNRGVTSAARHLWGMFTVEERATSLPRYLATSLQPRTLRKLATS